MREYETVFILRPQASEQEVQELNDRLNKLIGTHKGNILLNRSWGRRQLAFPIAKNKEGIYIHLDYAGDSTLITELEKTLNLDERVLRFLTVVLQGEVDIAKRTKELAQAEEVSQNA